MTSKRTGASSRSAIDPQLLEQLNTGFTETATLAEALAIDFSRLIASAFPTVSASATARMQEASALGVTKRMELAASILAEQIGKEAFATLRTHRSDTVRGWAAYVVGRDAALPLEKKLTMIRPLADDAHFGVREWAWLALRGDIAREIRLSIELLRPWTQDASENVRRFAIEATRPRGVWSPHINELKKQPELGVPLLDAVMGDGSRYVQNSCANWLNDAAKSDAAWVTNYCNRWRERNSSESVSYVTRRALRSLKSI